jgi:predicted kinase
MKTAYIMIGLPGSGKSTLIKNQNFDETNTVVISSDDYIEAAAAEQGKTYNDVYEEEIFYAISDMMDALNAAIADGKDIVWDQTSLTVKSRAKKIKLLGGYRVIAVVVTTPDVTEHERRLDSRHGKHIPANVLHRMISSFEFPTVAEGFEYIIEVQS